MKPVPNGNPLVPSHLNDAQILAYLDGELSPADAQRARAHLESCWTCRSWMDVVQGRINTFLRIRQSMLPQPTAFDDSRVEQFRQRLARHAQAAEAAWSWQDRVADFAASWRNRAASVAGVLAQHQRASIAAAMAICLVVVMFTDVLNTRVSADTVLSRAESYESAHVPATGLVARSSVKVERIDRQSGRAHDLGTITVVRDSATPLTLVSTQTAAGKVLSAEVKSTQPDTELLKSVLADDDPGSRLATYLASRNWVPEVSAAGFRSLIEDRESKDSSARRQGREFELHYPFAAGHSSGISEALLRVDAQDYAPSSISLMTGGAAAQREYRFTRTSLSFEPRPVEMAGLSLPAERVGSTGERFAAAPQQRRVVPLSYANSRASEAEVEAARALHRVDSCLGEEVYLFPMSDGSLLVQGLVETASRRTAIREALRGAPGELRIEVYLPREIRNGSELYNPPDQGGDRPPAGAGLASSTTLADLSSERMPLYESLYRHFSQPGASTDEINKNVTAFSSEVVTLARQTFLHAWALKKLEREFSASRTSGLSASAMQEVERMRLDHRRWIATLAHRQTEMLSELADPELVARAAQVSAGAEETEDVLRLAQEQNDLVRALFTTAQSRQDANANLAHLLALLRRMGS